MARRVTKKNKTLDFGISKMETKHIKTRPLRLEGTVVVCKFGAKDTESIEKAAKKMKLSMIEFIQHAAIHAAIRAARPSGVMDWSPEV